MNKPRVFMSYSHEDQPLVESVVHWLKDSEFQSADIDDPTRSVSWGDDVRTLITEKIRHADAVLVVWSDRAAKSPWVQYEVGIAQAFDVPIHILLTKQLRSELPTELSKAEVIKLDVPSSELAGGGLARNSVQNDSVSTALEDLKQQSRRIEQKVQQVSEMLSFRKSKRQNSTPGGRKERSSTAAAGKRLVAGQKRSQGHKKKATAKPGA